MAFTKIHGLRLANNGYVENLVVESLATDPASPAVGRIWFNSTDKVYKANFDGVVNTFASKEDLASTAANKGLSLIGYAGQTGAHGQFSVAATDAESALDSIVSEIDSVKDSLSSGTGALQTEVDTIEGSVGLGTDGAFVAWTGTNYLNSATSIVGGISALDTTIKTNDDLKVSKAGDSMTGALGMGGNKITNVATPDDDTDVANKLYVDSVAQGLVVKEPCRVATTATDGNLSLSGLATTIDGVTLVAGDRVLVKNQTNAVENGIYVAAADAWSRAVDFDGTPTSETKSGAFTFVAEGTLNDNAGFVLATNDPITIGTTELQFVQFSGAGQILAGVGLTKTGNTLDVNVGQGIEVDGSDNLQVKLDGSTLARSASGIKVADTYLDAVNTELTNIETGAGLNTDGTYTPTTVGTTYIDDATSLMNADVQLDAAIKTVADDLAAIGTGSLTTMQTEIDTMEGALGLGTDGSLVAWTTPNYFATNATHAAAIAALDTKVKDIATTFVYKSAVADGGTGPATAHTVTHNFNTEIVEVQVWVKDDDGKYKGDLVGVTVSSANAVLIDLTESRDVRVIVRKGE